MALGVPLLREAAAFRVLNTERHKGLRGGKAKQAWLGTTQRYPCSMAVFCCLRV